MKVDTNLDQYNLVWKNNDNCNEYRINKRDRIWRILKYGDVHSFIKGYYRASLDEYHAILSLNGEKDIVRTFEAESLPSIDYDSYNNTTHATSRMVERDITVKELMDSFDNHIIYDRQDENNWKIMSYIDDERHFLVVDSDSKNVITMYLD